MKKLNKKVELTGDTIEKFYIPCECSCSCSCACGCTWFYEQQDEFGVLKGSTLSDRDTSRDQSNYNYAN